MKIITSSTSSLRFWKGISGVTSTVLTYLEVSKLRIVILLAFVGFVAGVVGMASGKEDPVNGLMISTLAVVIATMGCNAITNFIDRDIDALMQRTVRRPLPTGRINPPQNALRYGLIFISVSIAIMAYSGLIAGAIWILLGLVFDIIVYNSWLKRRSSIGIILGAIAGGAPVMAVSSSVTGDFLALTPMLMAAIVVVWTPIHVWSLAFKWRDDYARVGVPMLPVVFEERKALRCIASTSILLVFFSLLLFHFGPFKTVYLIVVIPLGAVMVLLSILLYQRPSERKAWILFKFSSPYLAMIFLAMLIDVL